MAVHHRDVPWGMQLIQLLPEVGGDSVRTRMARHLLGVLLVTWLVYAGCHLVRMSFSVVKSTLNPKVTASDPDGGWAPFNHGSVHDGVRQHGKALLGYLDTAFLSSYAICMFFMGSVADRSNLRLFMTWCLVGNCLLSILLGMAYFWEIHEMWYFIFVQITLGMFQSTGWPTVLGVVGKWVHKDRRGFLMGVWNSHASIGNILGAVVPAAVLHWGWGWCLIVPGFIIGGVAIVVFLFLVVNPADVDLPDPLADADVPSEKPVSMVSVNAQEDKPLLQREHKPVKFLDALKIPGVVIFSLTLFFSKLVAYTFLYWLPYYVKNNKIGGKFLSASVSAYFSTLFDVGGIVGGIVAGFLCDYTRRPAVVNCLMLLLTVPILFLYRTQGEVSYTVNVVLLMFAGFFVTGPYALITTAVSAELGTHKQLMGNPKALSTVTAIIDGTGSIGAAIGPFLAGSISGWDNTFYMLMGCSLMGGILLVYHSFKELGLCRTSSSAGYTEIV